MKDFSDFRDSLTAVKITELTARAEEYIPPYGDTMKQSVNFSINFSLFLLEEYHNWLNQKN